MHVIEQGVPIPQAERPVRTRYPFRELEVGDSIYSNDYSMKHAAWMWARKNKIKITCRREGTGIRVWRTA